MAVNSGNFKAKLEELSELENHKKEFKEIDKSIKHSLAKLALKNLDLLEALKALATPTTDFEAGLSATDKFIRDYINDFDKYLSKNYSLNAADFNYYGISKKTIVLNSDKAQILCTSKLDFFNSLLDKIQNNEINEKYQEWRNAYLAETRKYLSELGVTEEDLNSSPQKRQKARERLDKLDVFYNSLLIKEISNAWKKIHEHIVPKNGQSKKTLEDLLNKQDNFNNLLKSVGIFSSAYSKLNYELKEFYKIFEKEQEHTPSKIDSAFRQKVSFDGKNDLDIGFVREYVRQILINDPDNIYAQSASKAWDRFESVANTDNYKEKKKAIQDIWYNTLFFLYNIKKKQNEFIELYRTYQSIGPRGEPDPARLDKSYLEESEKGLFDKLEERVKKTKGFERQRYSICLNYAKYINSLNQKMFPTAELKALINYSELLHAISDKDAIQKFADNYSRALESFDEKYGLPPTTMALYLNDKQAELILFKQYDKNKTKYLSIPMNAKITKAMLDLIQYEDADKNQKIASAPGIEALTE